MTAVVEGPDSYEGVGQSKVTMSEPQDAVIFVGISLVLGIACRHILKGTRVPYTVALLIAGFAMGSLEYGTHHGLGKVGSGIRIWANINPNLLLFVFLPALLFESSFAMEVHQIKKCLMQMLLLAGPGVVISTFFLGTALKFTFPYGWNYKVSLLLGGLLSATDPVAVVALLKELGASKKLSTIIEGESLMNDGLASFCVLQPEPVHFSCSKAGWFHFVSFVILSQVKKGSYPLTANVIFPMAVYLS